MFGALSFDPIVCKIERRQRPVGADSRAKDLGVVCVDIVLQPPKTQLRTDHLTFISCASTTQAPEFPTMASQVVTNFEKHLAQLAEGASRESIQTLSKYMAFNRKKHGAALCEALSNATASGEANGLLSLSPPMLDHGRVR